MFFQYVFEWILFQSETLANSILSLFQSSVFITKSNHKANRPFRFVTPATVTKDVRGVLEPVPEMSFVEINEVPRQIKA
jgi:hypothetical protein